MDDEKERFFEAIMKQLQEHTELVHNICDGCVVDGICGDQQVLLCIYGLAKNYKCEKKEQWETIKKRIRGDEQ